MEQKSVWLDEIKFKAKPSLKEDINCDILIIGGGITGISTALELKDEDGVVLIDKGKIGYGVTSHTTGKLTYLQGSIYDDIEKAHNFKTASRYLE